MGSASHEVALRSRNPDAAICKEVPQLTVLAESCKTWFPALAKRLWPGKTAAAVHHLTKEPERSCYAWVEGKNDPPARALLRLLDTDQGWRVLETLMRGSKQKWWLDCRMGYRTEVQREQVRQQIEMDF